MGMRYSRYDYLRYELFEVLLPEMLYWGTERERNEFFLKEGVLISYRFCFHLMI